MSSSQIYAGGYFKIEFDVRKVKKYPFEPPKARMLTKIWHPNIDLDGNICHNYLKVDKAFGEGAGYSPALGMSGIVQGILTLFYARISSRMLSSYCCSFIVSSLTRS